MYQRDYILRMIEQITTAIATISGLRKEQKQQQAFDLLEELLNRHFRLNSKLLTSLSERDIIGILQKDGVVESEKVLILAAMLKEEGDLYESLGEQDQAYLRHLKGLQLGLAASENNVETSALDYHADIQALIDRLRTYELPPQMKARLFVYHEKAGQYDQAENLLYELLPLNPEQMREIGIRFYENLLLKSPEEREAGGLPGEEVEEGLTDWLQKTAGVESV